AGVAGVQPMIVYGDNATFAFNADYAESDTSDMRWAVYFNPDADSLGAISWDSANATIIPNSSPTYTYPVKNYRLANGTRSTAETIILFYTPDGSTPRNDHYVRTLRLNALTATAVARNSLPDSLGRPFFEYLRVSAGNLVTVPSASLPPKRRKLVTGISLAD